MGRVGNGDGGGEGWGGEWRSGAEGSGEMKGSQEKVGNRHSRSGAGCTLVVYEAHINGKDGVEK